MVLDNERLKVVLIKAGLISEEEWDDVVRNAQRRRREVVDVLIERSVLSTRYLYELIAESQKMKYVDLGRETPDVSVQALMTEAQVVALGAFPFKKDEKKGVVAVAFFEVPDKKHQEDVVAQIGGAITPYLTTKKSFLKALRVYQKELSETLDVLMDECREIRARHDSAQVCEYPTEKIVSAILAHSVMLGVSDIHLEPLSDAYLVRMRVDGKLHDKMELPKDAQGGVIARLKELARLNTQECTMPQDGRFTFQADDEEVAARISTIPTLFGEKIVMRILNENNQYFNLDDLGFAGHDLDLIHRHIKKSHGLILTVGPTGSGKTTTLYTLLSRLNTEGTNLCTIEDPIEFSMARVTQTQVDAEHGYTFAAGLKALLRQDPEVILVGEIRDEETAQIAVHASLTGHLVLSTLHTDNTINVISRLVEMGIKPFVIAATLSLVIAQRLLRRICIECIESYRLTTQEIESLVGDYRLDSVFTDARARGIIDQKVKSLKDLTLYRGRGCIRCHGTGFYGRVAIYEVLAMNDIIKNQVIEEANAEHLKGIAMSLGMRTLSDDGWAKVLNGLTTIEELFANIDH